MDGLLFNKCKGDRVRVLLVRELEEMLQLQGETMQLVKKGLLSVIIVRESGQVLDEEQLTFLADPGITDCQGEGHMERQCTQPKRPRNDVWFKEKLMLAKAQESGQVLDEEQLAFLADPGITNCHDVQPTIIHNAAFQTNDLDPYDFDCDDISSAKAVLMVNLLSYDSDVLSEKEVSLDNDRLLDHIICQDVINIVMHVDYVLAKKSLTTTATLVNDNLEIKILEQENDYLLELILSQDIVHICVNSLASWNDCREMQQGFIDEYNENLMLKAELAKKGQMVV
ncbi:hypothetical protein Tco_0976950 [Tanacetum coccineum]|uniref:Retrovirus-related Pol polyprotein from transposon TNT 1-94 n=1 Tax=Tanacetum coccineum TaxID=301880 RepID=A0ABQ5EIQ9_9ASTR